MTDVSAAEGEEQQPKGLAGKILGKVLGLNKFVLIGIGAGLLIVAGGIYFFASHTPGAPETAKVLFYDLPDMTVNLSASPDRPQYLRVKVTLEVDNAQVIDAVRPVMPRVIDTFQTHIRELRVTDLEGSAGLFRLRDELTRRINLAIAPAHVRAVLFREIVIQ